MERAAGVLGEPERAPDRLGFGDRRARGDVVAPVGATPARRQRVVLRVHGHDRAEPRAHLHRGVQRGVVGAREVVHAAGRHERLEADHAALVQLLETIRIAGHDAAPQAEVDARRGVRGRELGIERGSVERRRMRVERHLEARGHAAGGERGGAGRPTLPVRPARLVEVHVRVEAAGEDVQAGRVDLLAPASQLVGDLREDAVGDADVGAAWAAGEDDGAAADDHVEGRHAAAAFAATTRTNSRAASIAAATSSSATASSGWWLIPPAQRTNSIAASVTPASIAASWPAPLASSGGPGSSSASAGASVSEVAPCPDSFAQRTRTPRRRRSASPIMRRAWIARARTASSAWRTSSVASTRPGITLTAPPGTPMRPTVATRPGSSRAICSAASTNSAAAASASWRSPIGVVPACPATPSKYSVAWLWPAIAVTTPSGTPAASSTGPCSMWTSKHARRFAG